MPRVDTIHSTKHRRNARGRAWQSMRILRRFTIRDLMETAEMGRSNAKNYIRLLERADYLVRTGTDDLGDVIYQLVRNTGPKAPTESQPSVWDPNTRQEYRIDQSTRR